jgi:hypothetical protein
MILAACMTTLFLSAAPRDGGMLDTEWGKQVEVEFIVDGSGSMASVVSGAPKIEWTRRSLSSILSALPETLSGADLGLRLFGNRSPRSAHDCQDTHLDVPLFGVPREKMGQALRTVHPSGYTPLAASLEAAAKDFQKDGDRIVVIVTDGVESCGGDPCAVSERLVKEGAFQRPYVVGFAVDEAEKQRLSCIGTYVDARSGEELQKLLDGIVAKSVVAARIEVRATYNHKELPAHSVRAVARQGGQERVLEVGKAVRVPPGEYELEVSQADDPTCGAVHLPATVGEGSVTHVRAEFGRGTVSFELPGMGQEDLGRTQLQIWPAGKGGQGAPLLQGHANQQATLCAGKYDFRLTHPTWGRKDVVGYEVKAQGRGKVPITFR